MIGVASDELALVEGARGGDETAFMSLVARYHPTLVLLAAGFTRDRAAAQDVALEVWTRFLGRLDGAIPPEKSIYGIAIEIARAASADSDAEEPSVVPTSRRTPPPGWPPMGQDDATQARALAAVRSAIERLPSTQGSVMTLRDVARLSSEEVCELLELTEATQRTLLHRARESVRQAIGEAL